MRKEKSLLFLMLLLVSIMFGQVKLSKDFEVSVGQPYPVIDAPSKEYFADGKGNAFLIKSTPKKVTIQKYDCKTMKELSKKEYVDFPKKFHLEEIEKVGDKLFYLYSVNNKKTKNLSVFVREVNMNDGSFKEAKMLFTTEGKISRTVGPVGTNYVYTPYYAFQARIELFSSFDNSKFLIRYRNVPKVKSDAKSHDVIGFQVFDMNFNKVWGNEVKMPHTEKEMNNIAFTVGKDGTAYMLAYLNGSKTYEWLSVKGSKEVKVNKLDIDGKLSFQEIVLTELPDGTFRCSGYYATGIDYKVDWGGVGQFSFNTNGLLSFKMNAEGKILEKGDYEFPIDLINQYESKRAKEKNEKREEKGKAGIRDLKLLHVVTYADGSTVFVGEQFYQVSERNVLNPREIVTFNYYADMIITKINAKGKLEWMKKLPKTQVTGSQTSFQQGSGQTLGIKYIVGDKAHYILYLDNAKNANLSLDEAPAKHSEGHGGFLTAYKINDATGAVEKHTLFDITDIKGQEAHQFKTTRIFEASEGVFMLEMYVKGKKDNMVKMEIKK